MQHMMAKLRRWLHPQAPSPDEHAPYRIFTRAHDKIVPADQLDTVLGGLSAIDRIHFDKACMAFDGALSEWRTKAQLAALEASNHVRNALSDKARSDTVVTILVDHSGSMKGQSILLAAAAAEVATDFIRILGIAVEVLGFTTVSWRGGKSRARWLWTRRPSQPGRLCDLLHIIHRSSDTQLHFGSSFRLMLRPNLLKENVDGEAIEWAVDRLRACPKTRKILVVISDGAPVDDSTLASNDLEILDRHLRQTVSTVEASTDIKIAALGISFDVSRYYATCTTIRTPEDLGTAMIGLLEQVLVEPTIRAPMTETAEQLST